MAKKKDKKNISNEVTDSTILICQNKDWEGPAGERLKQRGEENGVKGTYRVCPRCKGKDFYMKPQEYICRTFSVAEDMKEILRKYATIHGPPNRIATS